MMISRLFSLKYSLQLCQSTSSPIRFWKQFCKYQGTSAIDSDSSNSSYASNTLKKRPFSKEDEREFGELVYEAPNRSIVIMCKGFSLATSITTLAAQPFLISTMQTETGGSYIAGAICLAFSSVFMFTPIALNHLTKRFVMQMYYNPRTDIYSAIYLNTLVRERVLSFKFNDVKSVNLATSFLYTHKVGDNMLLLYHVGYLKESIRSRFESLLDYVEDEVQRVDDDDEDEPRRNTVEKREKKEEK